MDLELEREEHQMTDKQKEAIEEFEKLIKLRKNKAGEIKFDTCIVSTAQLEIVVNLIQTQQAEIDSLKDFKEIAESKVTDLNPIGLARTNQLLSRQCHKLQEESEKKDKIIKESEEKLSERNMEKH